MAERGAGTSPASASEPPSPATVSESGDVEAIGKPLAQCAGQRAAHLHVVGKIEIVGSHRCHDAFPDSVREIDAHDDADTQDQRKVVRDICAKSQYGCWRKNTSMLFAPPGLPAKNIITQITTAITITSAMMRRVVHPMTAK